MVSKVCSRSQGQPSGARRRSISDTSFWNFSPIDSGIAGAVSPQCNIQNMGNLLIAKPAAEERAPYYTKYIDLVPSGDIIGQLRAQTATTAEMLDGISSADSLHRYEPGKWSMRE